MRNRGRITERGRINTRTTKGGVRHGSMQRSRQEAVKAKMLLHRMQALNFERILFTNLTQSLFYSAWDEVTSSKVKNDFLCANERFKGTKKKKKTQSSEYCTAS